MTAERMPEQRASPPAPSRRYLVTGAGSGIGWAVVQALAAQGHQVLAGARRAADLERLAALPGVTALELDVCRPEHALAALAAIEARAGVGGPVRLDGIVHSAGIGELGHLAAWRDEDVLRLFETNVFGLMRLTRTLLAPLLAARGRVVVIGSMGGQITQPLYGPYTMTKHALEAYADCLHQELAPHGVRVSIVQPGAVATRIGEAAKPANEARLAATPPPFDAEARRVLDAWREAAPPRPDEPESAHNRRPAEPAQVAQVVLQALHEAAPDQRYLVGTGWEGRRVVDALIEWLLDAAASPGQRLDREAIVAAIDAALARRHADG
jgi:NAD(P)-dependent dehydrogenase (short-subunit alcohol dehydrogenase family)